MNKLPPSLTCRVCGFDLHATFLASTDMAERRSLTRQAYNGLCDPCQRARHAAALRFIAASDRLRPLVPLVEGSMPPHPVSSPLTLLIDDLRAAEDRCIALKMWGPDRPAPAGKYLTDNDLRHIGRWGTEKETE